MTTKEEIKNRIKDLVKGETELFSGSEIGKPGFGIFVHRTNGMTSYPVYEITQCGDWCGKYSIFDAVDFVAKEANL